MMIIDTSAYVGHWPFRKVRRATLPEVAETAAKNGITHMIVASIQAIFYKDTMEGNLELAEELRSYQGSVTVIPFAVVNPTYPAWEADMKRCINELGFRGIELAPAYHNYSLRSAEAKAAFRLAGELGVPVRVQNEFENIRQHHWMDVTSGPSGDDFAELLASCDKTCLILCGYFPCHTGERLQSAARAGANVFFDMRRPELYVDNGWINSVADVGISHLCFGTLSPFTYIAPSLLRLQLAPGTDADKQAILSENLRAQLGL